MRGFSFTFREEYMKLFFKYLFFPACLIAFGSCDQIDKAVCGQADGKEKLLIDSITLNYKGKLSLKEVDCYPGYMQVNLNGEVGQTTLDSIVAVCKKNRYVEIVIYNHKGDLIQGNTGSM